MRKDSLPQILIGAIVAVLVILGIVIVGGPETGRIEMRDHERIENLADLADYVACLADAGGKTLPEALSRSAACPPDTRFDDPFTGQPYRYERVTDTSFRLCAEFEAPGVLADKRVGSGIFEPSTGCVLTNYFRD